MSFGWLSHDLFYQHNAGPRHPECPGRLTAIERTLEAAGLFSRLSQPDSLPATDDIIERAHGSDYWQWLRAQSPRVGLTALDADTGINSFSVEAARLASGTAIAALDQTVSGQLTRSFCAVRPPGHHTEKNQAMGFCLLNHIAITALHAREQYGLNRIAIIDFDVHQGNGTVDILRDQDEFLVLSSFQYPFYPGRLQETDIAPNIVNSPLPRGSDGAVLRKMIREEWQPRLEQFQPQLFLVSAGFDAHRDDLIGGLRWDNTDYRWLGQWLTEQSETYCQGRLISLLEGGYNLDVLGHSVLAYLEPQL